MQKAWWGWVIIRAEKRFLLKETVVCPAIWPNCSELTPQEVVKELKSPYFRNIQVDYFYYV